MSEQSTTTKMCRVVAERWGLLRPRQAESIETCDWGDCWSETVAERSSGVGWLSVCDVHALIDIPNDPVAANALWDALSEDGYYVTFFNGIQAPEERHYCRLEKLTAPNLIPDVWMGRNANKWAALLDAAYQATLAEGQP